MNKNQKIGAKMTGHAAAQALAADAGAAESAGQAVKDLAEQMYDSNNGVIDTMEDIQRSKYMALGEDLDPEKWSGKDKELLLGILNGFDPSSNDQRAYMAAVAKALGADPLSPPAPVDEGIFQDRLLAPEQDVQKGCLILVSQYLLLDENNRCCVSPRDCAAAQRWFRHLAISEEEQNRLWAEHREFIQKNRRRWPLRAVGAVGGAAPHAGGGGPAVRPG